MNVRNPKVSLIAGAGALLTLGLLVYWPGLQGGFIFDDFPNLVNDPDWKVTSLDIEAWHRAMTLGISSDSGRPLAMLSFAMNYFATGLDPFWLKLTSVAMHLLNGLLVLLFCRQLIALMPAAQEIAKLSQYGTALITLGWTLHPLQVSSALYVVQRMEIGAATGTLVALLAYIHARRALIEGRRSAPWFLLLGAGFLFGLGFKETAILTPAYCGLIEFLAFRFKSENGRVSRPLLSIYAAAAVAGLSYYLLRILPPAMVPETYAFRDFSLSERLLTQLHVLNTYLGQIVAPIPDGQTFYYDNFPVSSSLTGSPAALFGLMVLALLLVTAWLSRHRWPLTSFGIAWFFIAHALTSNVLPLELAFEHRNYLALLGILLAAGQVLSSCTTRLNMDARRTMAALPVATLAILCALQVHAWADPFRLALTLDSRNPGSVRASYDLGKLMAERADGPDSPLFSMALKQFEQAGDLPSRSPLPEQARIIMLSRADLPVPAEVWERFREKLAAAPSGAEQINALHGVLDCRLVAGCRFDDQDLFQTFMVALERSPQSAPLHALYANFAWNVMNDRDLAISVMRHAIDLAPNDPQMQENLRIFLSVRGAEHGTLEPHPDASSAAGRSKPTL